MLQTCSPAYPRAPCFTSQPIPAHVVPTRSLLEPCPAPAITPRCRGGVGGGDRDWVHVRRDIVGPGDAQVSTGLCVPRPRHNPVPRGPQQRRPQHRVHARAGESALQSQPLPANTTQLPQLFPIVQAPEPCQPCSPGRPPAATPRQLAGAPRPATCIAAGRAPKSSAPSRDRGAASACTRGA